MIYHQQAQELILYNFKTKMILSQAPDMLYIIIFSEKKNNAYLINTQGGPDTIVFKER